MKPKCEAITGIRDGFGITAPTLVRCHGEMSVVVTGGVRLDGLLACNKCGNVRWVAHTETPE